MFSQAVDRGVEVADASLDGGGVGDGQVVVVVRMEVEEQ